MTTVLTTSPAEAAAFIHTGEVVAFPTETVYGLGADAFNEEAIARIYDAKGRPSDNPLIIHIATLDQLPQVAETVTPAAAALIDQFFPGPLTVILPRHPDLPELATGGLDTVGVRMPHHPIAQMFLQACACPVAAPSANRSGRPSPTSWDAVAQDLDGRIACILQADRTPAGLESTVVDCTRPVPVLLRAGVVPLEALRSVWATIDEPTPAEVAQGRSPGLRYRHYAPRARVHLVDTPADADADTHHGYIGLDAPDDPEAFGAVQLCSDLKAYAHELFAFFRRCDHEGLQAVYCQTVPSSGLGLALMDRLQRAADHTSGTA